MIEMIEKCGKRSGGCLDSGTLRCWRHGVRWSQNPPHLAKERREAVGPSRRRM